MFFTYIKIVTSQLSWLQSPLCLQMFLKIVLDPGSLVTQTKNLLLFPSY